MISVKYTFVKQINILGEDNPIYKAEILENKIFDQLSIFNLFNSTTTHQTVLK